MQRSRSTSRELEDHPQDLMKYTAHPPVLFRMFCVPHLCVYSSFQTLSNWANLSIQIDRDFIQYYPKIKYSTNSISSYHCVYISSAKMLKNFKNKIIIIFSVYSTFTNYIFIKFPCRFTFPFLFLPGAKLFMNANRSMVPVPSGASHMSSQHVS